MSDTTLPIVLLLVALAAVGVAIWALRSRGSGTGGPPTGGPPTGGPPTGGPPTGGPDSMATSAPEDADEDLASLVRPREANLEAADDTPTKIEGPPTSGSEPTAEGDDRPR